MNALVEPRRVVPVARPRPDRSMEVAQAAQQRLQTTAYSALRQVSCHCRDGTLILRGRLPSYFLKQMAQEVVTVVAGMARIVNEVEVAARSCWDNN